MFVHEFALLVAVATPLAALCSIHAGLWAAGERDTLMLPLLGTFPVLAMRAAADTAPAPQPTIPQNDVEYRLAA